jgi:hypothetical protein
MVNYLHLSDRFLSATWKKYLGIAFPDVWGSSQDKKKSLEKQMARPVKSNRLFIRSPSPPTLPPACIFNDGDNRHAASAIRKWQSKNK